MIVHCLYDKLVPISELKLNPENRNVHPREQIKRLAEILRFQGWRYPVKVSNQSEMVTAGHGRIEAALYNGWTEVPVNFQDYDTPEMEYADSIADNAIASWSELNLAAVHMDIKGLSTDFQVDMLGIEGFGEQPKVDDDEKDEKIDLNPQFIVSIHCTSESDMQEVFEEMSARGFQCKLIT